ncbi:MAG: hypothetical protein SVR81_02110 [Chloroflexota bacterium]|nr:hypothetical protein [Chloroflexota bacterium]
MGAIHWIRSRQESEELAYWASFVNFDPKDRSFNNRIYLVYLLIFFSLWWFMVMIWFAEAGAMLMNAIYPTNPASLAVALVLVVLLVWFVVFMIQSLRRSPVEFSGEDAYLVCQMPLKPQWLVLRWMAMPWFKSLVLFLLLGIVLGFSLARTGLAESGLTGQDLSGYFRLGTRAVLALIPFHLTLFTLNWVLGVWFMNRQRKFTALLIVIAICLVVLASMGFGIAGVFNADLPAAFEILGRLMSKNLQVGFDDGSLGRVLAYSWGAAFGSLVVLFFDARRFSPSRAAQETRAGVLLRNLRRYGLYTQAKEKKVQRRLGLDRRATWLPNWEGAAALVWKDMVQTWRTFSLGKFFILFSFFITALGLALLPGLSGRMLLILTWTMQASNFLTDRLGQDLAHWATVRQLPIRYQRWILAEVVFSGGIVLLVSLAGLTVGGGLVGRFPLAEALMLPGMIAAVAGVAAFVMFRNTNVALLLSGQVPGVNEFGVLGGAVAAAVPIVIKGMLVGPIGSLAAVLASLLVGFYTVNMAINGYRTIE